MYFDNNDLRTPLKNGTSVVLADEKKKIRTEYIIDSLAGSGGFAMMYIAHEKNNPQHFTALKELYPRTLNNAIAERLENDKIVIYNPLTESDEQDNPEIWEQIEPYFEREVRLTRRAAAVYDSNGRVLPQNNPDIFGIQGPYTAENGNRYIVIDTRSGKSMQQFIDNGWESTADKGKFRNNLLGEVLEILRKVTQRLTFLHGDHRMYHLDLSPANIYVSYINGGLDVDPIIIDYGSAYDRNDPQESAAHRFTCNPYSAPEITALAELNDLNAGYTIDVTSDTYNLAAILFYAVFGEVYTIDKIYDTSWKQQLYTLYPDNVYENFAEQLNDFFDKGLSSDQRERYVTIQPYFERKQNSLFDALTELQEKYKQKEADILSRMPPDELMSYLLLDKYPLYRYCSNDGDLHVLCLGSGSFVTSMIRSILGTGQMIGRKLYIHVVSGNAASYRDHLLSKAPLLENYADFGDGSPVPENVYVSFSFETVSDFADEETCRRIAEKYGEKSRYVIISLGANNSNITLARRFAGEIGNISSENTIIHYYMAEDSAQNIRADLDTSAIPPHVTIQPFGNRLSSFSKDVHKLGRKAFRLHYLYEKIYNSSAAKSQALKKFLADDYSQRSSAAAAVHIDYKLASLGISVAEPKSTQRSAASRQSRIIEQYRRCLRDPVQYGKLLQLEHTRWMFFMIADGYRLPSAQDHERYSFKTVSKVFNKAFKCTDKSIKLHHCLVPCSANGICLPQDHGEWNRYTCKNEIDASDYDALDKMSLYVHMLAGERIRRSSTGVRILSLVENDLREMLYIAPENESLKKEFESFLEWIRQVLKGTSPKEQKARFIRLQEQFSLNEIDITDIAKKISDELAVFAEYHSYKDYKEPDKAIIDHLLWVKFAEDFVMLKAKTPSVLSDIAAPLVIEPRKLIYLGTEPQETLTSFFRNHGNNTDVSYEKCSFERLDTVTDTLSRLIRAASGQTCIIDVTDAHPLFTAAAVMLASKDKKIGVISCDTTDFSIINIMNYPCAAIHRLNTSVSAGEIFGLYGAQEKSGTENYMYRLGSDMDNLWDFYRKYRTDWEMISAFFMEYAKGSSEVHVSGFPVPANPEIPWKTYRRSGSSELYRITGIEEILGRLQDVGLIRKLVLQETEAYSNLSFEYPVGNEAASGCLITQLDDLLTNLGNLKLKYRITPKSAGVYDIDIASGVQVSRHFKTDTFRNICGKKEFRLRNMEDPLRELEKLGIISSLTFDHADVSCFVSFIYSSRAVRDCLTTAGNILEAYVWHTAERTGYFDSLQANFSFRWHDSSVSNELDIILTKGLTTLVCSCKTAGLCREHLYEISDLTRRFSVNSKPVIIYSSDKAMENGKTSDTTDAVRERAREMGIYLIDRDILDGNLGEELRRIAEERPE
ncbi:MAG: hypothetical protein IKU40_04560 [Clostridia bacterium]|nr:hypothetical protein [Clostridia bacterium]